MLAWDYVLDRDSSAAAIYEIWMMKLIPLAYEPRIPESARSMFPSRSIVKVIEWMKAPDSAYGADRSAQLETRDQILLTALQEAVADLKVRLGDDMEQWKLGDFHTADFVHPLATDDETRSIFHIEPVRRSGDSYTVMNTTSASETNTKQRSGASFMFVLDVQDWDRSTGLSAPGNSAQPGSPHYKDLVPYWAEGKYFPLSFSRKKVEENTKNRLVLWPLAATSTSAPDRELGFEPVQPDLFSASGGQPSAWADFDNDGDLDLFVGFRGNLNRLYRNDGGKFASEIAAKVGLADAEDTRAASWGDFDADGHFDLYVGFTSRSSVPNRLYRNVGDGKQFTDVAASVGAEVPIGTTRQVSWIDYDNDGDVDLSIAFRDRPTCFFAMTTDVSLTWRRNWGSTTLVRQ